MKETSPQDFIFNKDKQEITEYKGSDKRIMIPNKIDGIKVKKIGEKVFYFKGIENIVFNKDLEEIGIMAFARNWLTSINLPPKLKTIQYKAFLRNSIRIVSVNSNIRLVKQPSFKKSMAFAYNPGDFEETFNDNNKEKGTYFYESKNKEWLKE